MDQLLAEIRALRAEQRTTGAKLDALRADHHNTNAKLDAMRAELAALHKAHHNMQATLFAMPPKAEPLPLPDAVHRHPSRAVPLPQAPPQVPHSAHSGKRRRTDEVAVAAVATASVDGGGGDGAQRGVVAVSGTASSSAPSACEALCDVNHNDWERVVAMYLTGAGTHDGRPLRDIAPGDGRRVENRKLLEKRRTIGRTFERLGKPAFERAIGYSYGSNAAGVARRKQRMYHVVARCRVVSGLCKAGVTLPTDPVALSALIDRKLEDKNAAKRARTATVVAPTPPRVSAVAAIAAAAHVAPAPAHNLLAPSVAGAPLPLPPGAEPQPAQGVSTSRTALSVLCEAAVAAQ